MIIRSADGESIVNFDNMSMVQIEEHEGKQRIVAYDVGRKTWTPIGEYSTKEQALNVIDGIIQTYAVDYCMGVYQMPPDELPKEEPHEIKAYKLDEPDPVFDEKHWQEVTDKTERNEG